MKKLIFTFVIGFSTITFGQTGKKLEAKPSKTTKVKTECYSTKEHVPLTCVRVADDEGEKKDSLKKSPATKPKKIPDNVKK
jgi:hypothetical protein